MKFTSIRTNRFIPPLILGIATLGTSAPLIAQDQEQQEAGAIEEIIVTDEFAEEKALHNKTINAFQVVILVSVFSTFGNDINAEAMSHADDWSMQRSTST